MLWIILTLPVRWLPCVGNAYGSTRRCRRCTLGCITFSRLLSRFPLLRSSSRVPGTQSRRPSSVNCPRSFRHIQLRDVGERETVGSCPHVAVFVVLVRPHFLSLRYILCWISLITSSYPFELVGSWPHVAMVVGLVCLHFPIPIFPKYTLLISLMVSSHSRFYDHVIYKLLLTIFAFNMFPSWKRWVELNFWGLAIGERGQLEVKDEKESMTLFHRVAILTEVYGAVCQLYLTLWNTTLAT